LLIGREAILHKQGAEDVPSGGASLVAEVSQEGNVEDPLFTEYLDETLYQRLEFGLERLLGVLRLPLVGLLHSEKDKDCY
jgi:hypothetical protein